jgi:signal transduction histidine kinase
MSLATRISLFVMVLLIVGGVAGSLTFYNSVHRSLDTEIETKLEGRLAWLRSSIELEEDDSHLALESRAEPPAAAEFWQVTTVSGKQLWQFGNPLLAGASRTIQEPLALGDTDWPEASQEEIVVRQHDGDHDDDDDEDEDRQDDSDNQDSCGPESPVEKSVGLADIEDGVKEWHEYEFPQTHRLQLMMTVSTSTAHMHDELTRLSTTLWTLVPGFVFITGLLLVLFIRWQLKPLQRMADQAQHIGPENVDQLLDSVGTTAEYVKLRESINAMLQRLSVGLVRERHFASAAAHELRTPIAQLRLGAEVALRRDREVADYRGALSDVLHDVDRLEHLIQGLLQLARTTDGTRLTGKAVSLWPMLTRVADDHGPVQLPDVMPQNDLKVDGDEQLLATAVGNVVANAHRYAPGRAPAIDVKTNNGHLTVTVTDHGPGISQQDRERIFEPLTRLDQARTIGDRSDGFGLGLAIARATVRAFGGELTCKERADGETGSAFEFSLIVRSGNGSA